MAKQTPTQKISAKLEALKIVSEKISKAEELKAMAKDIPEILAYIDDTTKRGRVDIEYLRRGILHQAANVALEMNVDKFEKFADGLGKLIS